MHVFGDDEDHMSREVASQRQAMQSTQDKISTLGMPVGLVNNLQTKISMLVLKVQMQVLTLFGLMRFLSVFYLSRNHD